MALIEEKELEYQMDQSVAKSSLEKRFEAKLENQKAIFTTLIEGTKDVKGIKDKVKEQDPEIWRVSNVFTDLRRTENGIDFQDMPDDRHQLLMVKIGNKASYNYGPKGLKFSGSNYFPIFGVKGPGNEQRVVMASGKGLLFEMNDHGEVKNESVNGGVKIVDSEDNGAFLKIFAGQTTYNYKDQNPRLGDGVVVVDFDSVDLSDETRSSEESLNLYRDINSSLKRQMGIK